ncbi:MAG: hypothetical protein R2705_18450 [Ilumatobacteraceae bacterium]
MTYAFTQDVPIDAAFHARLMEALGPELPKGLIMHLATERSEGGLSYVDVWESADDCDRFVEERLHPALGTLLGEVFGDTLPPEPERCVLPVAHLWHR